MSNIDYTTDLLKHYVRMNGWLAASRKQKKAIRKRNKNIPLRYFTFCAAEAIDVFMLELYKILDRSKDTGWLNSVYFCEKDENSFGRIADLIGSPTQGFLGSFEKIVLFEDDETTKDKELNDEEEAFSEEDRKKLQIKDAHLRFRKAFPFDIINLDVCGVMFPPRKGVITPLLRSILKILEWQTNSAFSNGNKSKQFTLFLTSHLDPQQTDQEAITQLENRLSQNIEVGDKFKAAFKQRFHYDDASRLKDDNFAEFFCLAFPKYLTEEALTRLGWMVDHKATYLYNRPDIYQPDKTYQIMHSVITFQRLENFNNTLTSTSTQYIHIVTQLVELGVKWIDKLIDDPKTKSTLEEALKKILEFRDHSQSL